MMMLKFKPEAPGILYLLKLFQTRTQVVLLHTIYLLFSLLLILDSYYLVDFSLSVMVLWSIYIVLGIWFIKRTLQHNHTNGLCYYLICSSVWWSGAVLLSGGLESPLFYFGEILLILYGLSGSFLMNTLGGGLYIGAITASTIISIQTTDYLAMILTVIVVNLLTLAVGFLASHAIHYHLKSTDQWQRRALTDYLTGLSNREGFIEQFTLRPVKSGLFGIFDLNGFKEINDEHGHDFGDEVLIAVAKAFKQGLPNQTKIGRIGGDEFVFFIPDMDATDEKIHNIRTLVETSVQKAGKRTDIMLNASVGLLPVVASPDFRELYRRADQLMYENKRILKQTN